MSAMNAFLIARTVEPIFDPSCAVETKFFLGHNFDTNGPK